MAATTIIDNGASIKITVGSQVRNIIKAQIIEISVIRTNIIKIDIGQGALDNIFIPYAEVTQPVLASPEALRDAINALLTPIVNTATATEAKQTEQIDILNVVKDNIQTIQNLMSVLDKKIFYEPLLEDDGGAGIIYKGYALVGSTPDAPLWAIERIQKVGDVDVHNWADGDKLFNNVWNDRESLSYS
jgi:hypothetical protein